MRQGKTNAEIVRVLEVGRSTVQRWRDSFINLKR
jgi:transposase